MRRTALILVMLLGASACSTPGPQPAASDSSALRAGPWHAWLDCQQHELPFDLELRADAAGWRATVVNGEERIDVPQLALADGTLTLGFPHYDSAITASVSQGGARIDGTWRKRRSADEWVEMPFHATAGSAPRFAPDDDGKPWEGAKQAVAGRWAVDFASDDTQAVGEFQVVAGDEVRGTFLTTTGDYRYLAGRVDEILLEADSATKSVAAPLNFKLRLSCFDGAHAFLFAATSLWSGPLSGDFWSGSRSHDTWTAQRDPEAALPDGFTLTHASGKVALSDLVFPDLDGVPRRLSDPQFAGRARILEVFGSWCPNCADEADDLVKLQQQYGPRGLSILGLAFELTGDRARDAEQVRRYAKRHGVTWPLLVAGVSDREKATAALGLLDHLNAYPTTIFLDAAGEVRAVYTGYCGPATGEDYAQQHAAFVKLIENLLGS